MVDTGSLVALCQREGGHWGVGGKGLTGKCLSYQVLREPVGM